MGLSMYLTGETFIPRHPIFPRALGERKGEIFHLGYWRKHHNLHDFIVTEFANGVDECQIILLDSEDIEKIIAAIENKQLPPASGPLFGQSDGSEKPDDLLVFRHALSWLRGDDGNDYRSVHYQASW